MCHSEAVCRYHINRALKTDDHQVDNLAATNRTINGRYDNSRYHQRRKSRQLDDPLSSVRKGNEYYDDMEDNLLKHN